MLLREKVLFFKQFLEIQETSEEIERLLESRMADAAHAAEDLIESLAVDQITIGSYPSREDESSAARFSRNMQIIIEKMNYMEKVVMEIKDRKGFKDQQHKISIPVSSSILAPSPSSKNTVVGLDDDLTRIMDRLDAQQSNNLQIVTIVGMGGIGKTTLARNAYENPYIVLHFYIRAWVTISQTYNVRATLLCLLYETVAETTGRRKQQSIDDFVDEMRQARDDQLGEQLHKSLSGMRYLIVMDDMWSTEAWNEIKMYFPDNSMGSRIMVTSRLSNVAVHMSSCSPYKMDFLDDDKSWDLLCEKAFQGQVPPTELAGIGEEIAKNCKGLPLAIVVIGGLLAKSMNREYWEYVAENVSTVVNSENDHHFLRILALSYTQLPIHLKPCFLYMAAFPEDCEVDILRLIRLWVAEGFLKPIRYKTLEEAAEEYLEDLIERNLILVRKRGQSGKVKSCSIHDLLRDLCLKEAKKNKFLCVTRLCSLNSPSKIERERGVCIHQSNREEYYHTQDLKFARSLVCSGTAVISTKRTSKLEFLRVLDTKDRFSIEEVVQLVNSRHLSFTIKWDLKFIPPSIFLLWNLQTLVVKLIPPWKKPTVVPSEIWQMPTLRHVELEKVALPDPPCMRNVEQDHVVLDNLQTFLTIVNFQCSEDVVKIIPNLKNLKIRYQNALEGGKEWSYYCLNNLIHLTKLESLNWYVDDDGFVGKFALPHSLKKLSLEGCEIPWEDMAIIGSLPNLEVLKLKSYAFQGALWEPVEGEFTKLKYLLIEKTGLVHWRAGRDHFPCLERLVIRFTNLEEIPCGIGEISTLKYIQLDQCPDSTVISAKQIQEEQDSLGNYGLQVKVSVWKKWEMQSLESDNFYVHVVDDDRKD